MRIGLDLGGTKIEGIALDRGGNQCARHRIPAPRGDYEATIAAIIGLVATLEAQTGADSVAVGIGIPGALSPSTGLIKNANSTWLIGSRLDQDLATVLRRPVRITNDANCFALSEAVDGAAAGAEVCFGVILGTGVGAGVVIGGKALVGRNAIAGEWGHNPLPWALDDERPGRPCYCGETGCIETFLSGPGLAADHVAAGGSSAAPEAIAERARQGDPSCAATLARYEDRLARALASVINVLDPDVVVLGGGLSKIERLYRSVPRLWGRHVFSDDVATELRPPHHGDAGGVRGAAWLWSAEEVDR
ncbi:MAG: ROK family protein [Alphaproteobacteria bacterium]|nr:ROK family protein [Alphaproteobacteria bacterium]